LASVSGHSIVSAPGADAAVFSDRIERTRRAMREQGIDVTLLSVGLDMPYLTGYHAMPLERLTMLVLPVDGDATLVVPRLEAPRVNHLPEVFDAVVARFHLPSRGRRVGPYSHAQGRRRDRRAEGRRCRRRSGRGTVARW